MEKGELLAEFKAQLELFDKYQTYIEKARSYADKFNPAVVEKVISDNTAKIRDVADVLDPLIADMRSVLADLDAARGGVQQGVENARMQLEELELRQVIGELTESEFLEQSSDLKSKIDNADNEIADIDEELDDYRSTLERWTAGRPELDEAPAIEEDDDLLGDLEDDAGIDLNDDDDDDLLDEAFSDDGPGDAGVHAHQVSVRDDVSAVFAADDDEEEPLEAGDEEEPDVEVQADDDGGDSFFGDSELSEIGGDPLEFEAEEEADDSVGEAFLVLQEGTPDEHVFPIGTEVISLGRGRDNSIQVKNDSKVSRYHCKLFERGGNYFIEDNKSANGTLVDGELITEKRLIGGEEVIIGETLFRFRLGA
jgi:regulator of replication initiation timing